MTESYAVRSAAISSKAATKAFAPSKECTTERSTPFAAGRHEDAAVHVVEPGEVCELAVLAL